MPLYRPEGPRPIVDGSNTTVQDLADDYLAFRDPLVRVSDRAKSADETHIEAEYRALLLLADKYATALEEAAKRVRKDFCNSIRRQRDAYKAQRKASRDISNILK